MKNYFKKKTRIFSELSGGDVQWSIPVETNKRDEKYLALPNYGDIKLTSYSVNKTVKILLEHIDFVSRHIFEIITLGDFSLINLFLIFRFYSTIQQKKEFNVKVVHTKLSSPNSNSNNDLMSSANEKSSVTHVQRIRQSSRINSETKPIIHNFLANIFIKEVNLILYDDHKDNLYKKNNIASIFLDDFIICYVEEVIFLSCYYNKNSM